MNEGIDGRPSVEPAALHLDPERDPNRWEDLMERINERAAPILEGRRQSTLVGALSGWRRPVITGAAGLMAAAIAALLVLPTSDAAAEASLAETVVPWSVAAWMDGTYTPTIEELVLAVEEFTP